MTGLTKYSLASNLQITIKTLRTWVRSYCDSQPDPNLYEVYLSHRVLPPFLAGRLCAHFGL